MAKYSGQGWHFQSKRHSNARKYGRAGGTYKKSIILGTMSSPTKPQIFMSGKDRIEMTYDAIDEMNRVHGTPRPMSFGGRKWDKNEELAIYVKQVGDRYTPLQWKIMLLYAKQKGFNTSKAQKELGKIYGKHYGKSEYNIVPRGAGWEHYPIKTGFKTEEEAREYAKKELGGMRGVRITQSTKHHGKSELKKAYLFFSDDDLREAHLDANTNEKKRISLELERRRKERTGEPD